MKKPKGNQRGWGGRRDGKQDRARMQLPVLQDSAPAQDSTVGMGKAQGRGHVVLLYLQTQDWIMGTSGYSAGTGITELLHKDFFSNSGAPFKFLSPSAGDFLSNCG